MKIREVKSVIGPPLPISNKFWGGKKFLTNWGYHTHYTPVLVKVGTDDGVYGVGEAAEFHPMEAAILPECLNVMINKYLGPAIVGEDPSNINKIRNKMNRVIWGNLTEKTAKSAIEMALFDIVGKAWNVPAVTLLGGAVRQEIPGMMAIGMMEPVEMEKYARKIREETGCRFVKYKAGGSRWGSDPELDIERAKAIREGAGDSMIIIQDFNMGYRSVNAAKKMLRKCEEYSDYFEQPLWDDDFEGMGSLAKTLDSKIIADESAHDPKGVVKSLEAGVRFFNIKPQRSGGINEAMKSIAMIEEFGGACSVDGIMEDKIGLTAFTNVSAAVPEETFIVGNGSDQVLRLGDSCVESGGLQFDIKKGVITLPTEPGLGIALKKEILEKFEK